jgi:hypothetical protein
MSTIIAVSPLGRQADSTEEVIRLQVYVTNSDFFGIYDRMEVWRSKDRQSGPYEELTAENITGARIPKDAADPPASPITGPDVTIVGLELDLLVDEQEEEKVTFVGVDPLSYSDIATQIAAQAAGVDAYVSDAPQVVLQTVGAGTAHSLRVVGGDAAALLGLPTEEPDSLAYGRDARVVLVDGRALYEFTDLRGSADYYYKIRFRNSSSGAVSEFSLPHNTASKLGIDPEQLALGVLDLVQANGKPLINQPVRVHTEFNGTIVDGKVMAGTDVEKSTDANGHVEFLLVRGQRVSIAVPGTSLVRDITVPEDTSVETFNLVDPTLSGDDVFRVQSPSLVYAPRRSL